MPRQHLWNFFRPEFLKSYSKPLSSDSLSGFGSETIQEDLKDIREATKYLQDKLIPKFALDLQSTREQYEKAATARAAKMLVAQAHLYGINIRFFGLLVPKFSDPYLQTITFGIILSRILMQKLRWRLRKCSNVDEALHETQVFSKEILSMTTSVLDSIVETATNLYYCSFLQNETEKVALINAALKFGLSLAVDLCGVRKKTVEVVVKHTNFANNVNGLIHLSLAKKQFLSGRALGFCNSGLSHL